jgi:hypothetical protein
MAIKTIQRQTDKYKLAAPCKLLKFRANTHTYLVALKAKNTNSFFVLLLIIFSVLFHHRLYKHVRFVSLQLINPYARSYLSNLNTVDGWMGEWMNERMNGFMQKHRTWPSWHKHYYISLILVNECNIIQRHRNIKFIPNSGLLLYSRLWETSI